jgi:hypothetical protein
MIARFEKQIEREAEDFGFKAVNMDLDFAKKIADLTV